MGDPRKSKKKYKTPTHPWQKSRLDDEGALVKEYGLKNKRELWKMSAKLRGFKQRSKRYIADTGERALQERNVMLKRLASLGLLSKGGQLDDVLGLSLKEVMERRLQTVVYKHKMACSIGQARQFITHRHIEVGGVRMTSPSYLVSMDEEATVRFTPGTGLASDEHPERVSAAAQKPKKADEEGAVRPRNRGSRARKEAPAGRGQKKQPVKRQTAKKQPANK